MHQLGQKISAATEGSVQRLEGIHWLEAGKNRLMMEDCEG